MTGTATGTATGTKLQEVLALTQTLTSAERNRLKELLNRDEDVPLPEQATMDEAIELYLAEACGLGRAAELAGVTRWTLIDRLKEHGLWTYAAGDETAEEIDRMAEQLRSEGILCSSSATQTS
jgi:predicted HTH domain antitoxin